MSITDIKKEPLSSKINLVYSRLCELTDGETDPELMEYNEFLLSILQDARHALLTLETGEENYGKL